MLQRWSRLAIWVTLTWPLRCAWSQAALPAMPALTAQDRVLVVAPHPDDESLCCAGLLQRARASGAAIAVVWITAGDGFEFDAMLVERTLWPSDKQLQRLGAQRLTEAHSAASELGVPAAQQYVLGYPDRGVVPLLGEFYQHVFQSKYTGLSAVSYAQAQSPYASYTGANLERDLGHVIDQFHPTLVLAAAPEDTHPDHHGSGALVRRLLEQRGELSYLRYWIVHAPQWPAPRGYLPQRSLSPPASAANLQWQTFTLSAEERSHKLAAVRDHRSQMQLMSRFMLSFVRANELYTRGAN